MDYVRNHKSARDRCAESSIYIYIYAPDQILSLRTRVPVMQYIRCCGVEGVACETSNQLGMALPTYVS